MLIKGAPVVNGPLTFFVHVGAQIVHLHNERGQSVKDGTITQR